MQKGVKRFGLTVGSMLILGLHPVYASEFAIEKPAEAEIEYSPYINQAFPQQTVLLHREPMSRRKEDRLARERRTSCGDHGNPMRLTARRSSPPESTACTYSAACTARRHSIGANGAGTS